MQQQEIADRLHAAFLKSTVTGKPWLAVAQEAENIQSEVPTPSMAECVENVAKQERQHRMLNVGETIKLGDQVLLGEKWIDLVTLVGPLDRIFGSAVNANARDACHIGYYRRPLAVEQKYPSQDDMDELFKLQRQSECNMALEAAVEFGSELDFLQAVIERQKEKLKQAATYIEGLERDLAFHTTDRTYENEADPVALRQQRDNWEQTASQHYGNEQYYRSLVVQIGEMFGIMSRMCDDGVSISEAVLCHKVPELVQHLFVELYGKV